MSTQTDTSEVQDVGSSPSAGDTSAPNASDTGLLGGLLADNRGQQDLPGVIIMVGVAVVAGFVVLFLANEVIEQLNMSSGDPLYNSWQSLEDATNSAFGLFGILFIVAIMVVAIGYLYRLVNR